MKLELLTNATAVNDAIRFVSQKSNEKLLTSTNRGDNQGSKEPDYGEDQNQLEKDEAGKISMLTRL
jgi:hypothetical protein